MNDRSPAYWAVYGSHVALESKRWVDAGTGFPTEPQMRRIVEEAHAVAALSERCQPSLEDA